MLTTLNFVLVVSGFVLCFNPNLRNRAIACVLMALGLFGTSYVAFNAEMYIMATIALLMALFNVLIASIVYSDYKKIKS